MKVQYDVDGDLANIVSQSNVGDRCFHNYHLFVCVCFKRMNE